MKARIVDFITFNEGESTERIEFRIEFDRPFINLNMKDYGFEIVGKSKNGNSIISFTVNKNRGTDKDDDITSRATVPFQIAYAVSITRRRDWNMILLKLL